LLLPILLCADELRSLLPFGGFGWNRLSFSQAGAPYIAIAKYFGDSSLAFIAITLGIAFYLLWARAQLSSVAVILFLASILIIVPALLPAQNVRGSASILGIQGNVPRLGLDFNSQAREVFEYHLNETEIAINEISSKPDVIVWPENSVDVDPFVNKEVGSRIAEIAIKYQTPIIVGDSPGFATSRLGLVIGLEAIRMVEEGVASAEDIDKGMVLGYKYPIGPLKLTDMVGLDVRLAIAEYLHSQLGDRFEPPALLRKMVADGKLGQKSGEGFYKWEK
jgi:hypothetical protein